MAHHTPGIWIYIYIYISLFYIHICKYMSYVYIDIYIYYLFSALRWLLQIATISSFFLHFVVTR